MSFDDAARIEAYIVNVEKALDKINVDEINGKEKEIVEIARAYLSDAKYYFEKDDYFTSLACIAYAEGLIDSLRYSGIIDIEWEPLTKLLKRPKVLVAGGFEILHPGHIYLFKEAWRLGRVYVVVARDENFRKYKNREPAIPEDQRRRVVEGVKYVYKAVLGDKEDYLRPVKEIDPDIILLGPDQWPDESKLVEELRRRGLKAEVKRLNKRLSDGLYSVTRIIERILEINNCKNS